MTAPVSGSIKVRTDGINTINNIFKMNNNSSVILGLLYLSLKSVIILDIMIIKKIFINSLGWRVPIKGILNQHLALLTVLPKNNTRTSEITPIKYKIQALLYRKISRFFRKKRLLNGTYTLYRRKLENEHN